MEAAPVHPLLFKTDMQLCANLNWGLNYPKILLCFPPVPTGKCQNSVLKQSITASYPQYLKTVCRCFLPMHGTLE